MSTGTHPSSAETGDEPQDQAESHTEQNAGGQWKIKRGVLAFMNDVTGQVAQPERKLSAKIKKCADKRENARNKEQCPCENSAGHRSLLRAFSRLSAYFFILAESFRSGWARC